MAGMFRIFIIVCLAVFASIAARADTVMLVAKARVDIEARLEPGDVAMLRAAGGPATTAAELASLGHAFTLKRHFVHGAWAYAAAIERDRALAGPYSSLGVLLAEGVTLPSGAKPDEPLLAAIVDLQREARRLDGKSTAIANNLGSALSALGARQENRSVIEEGAFLIHEAVAANPQNVIYYVRLAEALALIGETSAAGKFLEAAYMLNSAHPSVVMSRRAGGPLADVTFASSSSKMCEVNYACDAKCPKSIIGQIDLVTCKIAESSAQSACQDRKPFARFFDCKAKIPKFGILIPGLDPGFSILTPWGSIHAVVQGDGRVDFEIKVTAASVGPAQVGLKTEGNWEPSRGDIALNFEGEAQLNLFDRVSPVMEQANAYDLGISVSEKYNLTENTLEADINIGRGGILTD